MRVVLTAIRVVTILVTMLLFLAHMSVVWFIVRDRWKRVRWSNRILRYYSRWGLWVLRVHVNVIGAENLRATKSGLFV